MHPLHQRTASNAQPACLGRRPIRFHGLVASLRRLFRRSWRLLLFLGLCISTFAGFPPRAALAQPGGDPTSTPNAEGAFITVIYIEPINVRAGPGTYDYPIIGSLPVGGTAPAIARSPAGEWIQISFSDGPKGLGWVYAPNVRLTSQGLLPVVPAPPTATPATTPTINPTYAAALQAVPTATRKATFTAPPPLQLPTYATPEGKPSGRLETGWVVIGLAAVGLFGMAVSFLRRR